ncbi:MAG: lysoplasmalogenase [Litorilituus sp.]|nr:lysoplasmalogenase [Litorilituus sp.]
MKNSAFNISKTSILFVALATAFVLSTLVTPYPLSWAVKLLPMLLLIGIAIQRLGFSHDNKYFILGLIGSACGDFILDFNREHWFIFGLAAFFIAHLFYLISLKPEVKKLWQVNYLMVFFVYLGYGLLMLLVLIGSLEDMLVPVTAYMSILLLMALATVLSYKTNSWLILGGISFVFSDSLLGIDKFYTPIEYGHFFVMISYYFAQFALLKGFIIKSQASHP